MKFCQRPLHRGADVGPRTDRASCRRAREAKRGAGCAHGSVKSKLFATARCAASGRTGSAGSPVQPPRPTRSRRWGGRNAEAHAAEKPGKTGKEGGNRPSVLGEDNREKIERRAGVLDAQRAKWSRRVEKQAETSSRSNKEKKKCTRKDTYASSSADFRGQIRRQPARPSAARREAPCPGPPRPPAR